MNTTNRLNYLPTKLTAFNNLAELKAAAATGYVPTILIRTKRHGELVRLLRAEGVNVWTGSK